MSALTNFALIAKITRPNSLAPKIITTLQTDEWESPRARDSSSSIIEPSDSQGNIDPNVSYEEGHVSLLKWRLFGNRVMFGPDGKLLAPLASALGIPSHEVEAINDYLRKAVDAIKSKERAVREIESETPEATVYIFPALTDTVSEQLELLRESLLLRLGSDEKSTALTQLFSLSLPIASATTEKRIVVTRSAGGTFYSGSFKMTNNMTGRIYSVSVDPESNDERADSPFFVRFGESIME